MRRAIRKHLPDFVAILALMGIATGVSLYILQKQRLRIPFLEESPFVLRGEFATAQAVTAGQGQTVRVSGVRIGDIGRVELKEGRGIIVMDIDREYRRLIHDDATALLRPKTGLKDMFVELDPGGGPGSKPVGEGFTIPIARTLPDVNPDEVLSVLDQDTRDHLQLLLNGAGRGLDGRASDLRDVLKRFEPTHRDLARVNVAVSERRRNLRRLINSLQRLNTALARKDEDLTTLVSASSRVFRAFASEERNVSSAVAELPGALAQTTDTLQRVRRFADLLAPTADRLRPAIRQLDVANREVRPFARAIAPVLADPIRPFVREARPVVRDLRPAARGIARSTADLTSTFRILNRAFNMLAFNPGGREAPGDAERQEGYLFWLAWVQHQGVNLFRLSDAHGIFRPLTLGQPCQVIRATVSEEPELVFLEGLATILTDPRFCGATVG